MKSYIKMLDAYLEDNRNDPESALQILAEAYLEEYPITGEQINILESKLSPVFDCVPLDLSNDLFQTVYTLCWEYGKAGFCTGLRTGLRLQREIDECKGF
ncbi:MAG: hypothetical protein J6B67_00175 [Oscillospiraceae bacterium]|nr:hypothetical protein [Oscillospiraceae bacterium]